MSRGPSLPVGLVARTALRLPAPPEGLPVVVRHDDKGGCTIVIPGSRATRFWETVALLPLTVFNGSVGLLLGLLVVTQGNWVTPVGKLVCGGASLLLLGSVGLALRRFWLRARRGFELRLHLDAHELRVAGVLKGGPYLAEIVVPRAAAGNVVASSGWRGVSVSLRHKGKRLLLGRWHGGEAEYVVAMLRAFADRTR